MTTTMGMGIGINTDRPDSGIIKREQLPVACGVWFTSTGRTIPKLIKYENQAGERITLTDFQILLQEEKYYCGISTIEYYCQLVNPHHITSFRLLYYIEQKEWKLSI